MSNIFLRKLIFSLASTLITYYNEHKKVSDVYIKMEIAEKIKKLRLYLDLTQEKFGEKIGVKKAHISDVERGDHLPSLGLLVNIVNSFKIDARYFFDQIESPEEADLTKRKDESLSSLEALRKEIADSRRDVLELKQQVNPVSKIDPVAERVMIDQVLHDLVSMIQYWDANAKRRLIDIAYGMVQGRALSEELEQKKRNAS